MAPFSALSAQSCFLQPGTSPLNSLNDALSDPFLLLLSSGQRRWRDLPPMSMSKRPRGAHVCTPHRAAWVVNVPQRTTQPATGGQTGTQLANDTQPQKLLPLTQKENPENRQKDKNERRMTANMNRGEVCSVSFLGCHFPLFSQVSSLEKKQRVIETVEVFPPFVS